MRRRVLLAAALCAALVVRGGQELEEVELVRALGVDAPSGEEILVTAAAEKGVYQAAGTDVLAAQENLRWEGQRRLELTHVTALVLGERARLGEILEREVLHRKSGYGARVWLAKDADAGALLRAGEDVAARLRSLEENAGVEAPTVLEALSTLRREGAVRLPTAALREGELVFAGYVMRGEGEG